MNKPGVTRREFLASGVGAAAASVLTLTPSTTPTGRSMIDP